MPVNTAETGVFELTTNVQEDVPVQTELDHPENVLVESCAATSVTEVPLWKFAEHVGPQ